MQSAVAPPYYHLSLTESHDEPVIHNYDPADSRSFCCAFSFSGHRSCRIVPTFPPRPRAIARSACVGIDWGARRRGIHVLAADGTPLACHEDGEGLLGARGRVMAALDGLLGRLDIDVGLPMLVSGLHGVDYGGRDIPSLSLDVPLMSLARHLVRLEGRRYAVPRIRAVAVACRRDARPGHAPGGAGSRRPRHRLGRAAWGPQPMGLSVQWSSDPDGFDLGLELARRGLPLSQALYSVRASVQTGAMPPEMAAPMLSGLLIGVEFHATTRATVRDRSLRLVRLIRCAPCMNGLRPPSVGRRRCSMRMRCMARRSGIFCWRGIAEAMLLAHAIQCF